MNPRPLLLRLVAKALTPRDRDVVLADLWESSEGQRHRERWAAWQTLKMAAHQHFECYRDPRDASRLLGLLIAGVVLMIALRVIALGPDDGLKYFSDPIMRAILAFWQASHLTSALGAGLLIGFVPLPSHLSAGRWHVAVLLAAWVVATYDALPATVGVLALAGAVALASRARASLDDGRDMHVA